MKLDQPQPHLSPASGMPETPISRWVQPIARFFQIQSASGFLLLACTAVALLLANSPWSASFADIWQIRLRVAVGNVELNKPLLLCINDGLMTIFFFVIGLEIKREFVAGELRDPRKAALPIVAALGGMIVPASIYLLFQGGRPGQSGWGIPVATDIAFVAGFLALLGSRVPASLKIMLISLAIADDIGAILLIAFFYATDVSFVALALAAVGFGVTYFFNRIGVRQVGIYVVVGAVIWLAFLKSGVHPTVAGLVLGKPIGIVLFSWIATNLGFARLPSEVNWMILLGAGCLAGIGFTMSIFMAGLALQGDLLDDGKIGTLVGSTISAILGCVLLLMFMPKRPGTPIGAHEE